jgi:hypothetical protein
MIEASDILTMVGAVLLAAMLLLVMRARRKSHGEFMEDYARREVCPHLQPVLQHLLQNGHRVARAGQHSPEMPLEIHVHPPFDPQGLYDQLLLQPPVHISGRNALYCKEDWCEIHPEPGGSG